MGKMDSLNNTKHLLDQYTVIASAPLLNVGVIGFGNHVQKAYLKVFQNKELINLDAICDLSSQESHIKSILPDIPFYDNIEQFINNNSMDCVIISTPNNLHYPFAKKCLNENLNVFLDKPLALQVNQAKELIDLSAKKQKMLYVGLPKRYSPYVIEILSYFHSGELGRIVELDFDYHIPHYEDFKNSWRNCPGNGGGVLADAGYHIVDLLVRFVDSKAISIKCQLENHEFNVDASARISAKFKNKTIANVGLSLKGPRQIVSERISIYGTEATLYFNRIKAMNNSEFKELVLVKSKSIQHLKVPIVDDADVLPLLQCFDDIKNGKHDNTDLQLDLQVIEFIQRAYKNAQNNV